MRYRTGNVLLLAVLVTFVLAVSAATLVGISMSYGKSHLALNSKIAALYACEAGLEMVRLGAKKSEYDFNGNRFLDEMASATENASGGGPGMTIVLDPAAGHKVDVWVVRKGGFAGSGLYYRVLTRSIVNDVPAEAFQDLRDRDSFARYLFFVNTDDMPYGSLRFGTTTCNGYVHSNGRIYFSWGNAVFHELVSAVNGFEYDLGASPSNTSFLGGSNPRAAPIEMPTYTAITALKPSAMGVFDVSATNPMYADYGNPQTGRIQKSVQIDFGNGADPDQRGKLRLVIRNGFQGAILSDTGWVDYPANGLIYVEGDVDSLKGDVLGRVTLAVNGAVNIVDDIRYIDADGDPAYMLVDGNGQPLLDTPVGTEWGTTDASGGIRYIANSAYNPAVPSVLGLLTRNDIEVKSFPGVNYNLQVHAAMFVTDGNFHCALTNPNGNLRTLGSMVTQNRGWRYNGHTMQGWALSGEYIYDDDLVNYPPPFWLKINVPVFGPVVRVR